MLLSVLPVSDVPKIQKQSFLGLTKKRPVRCWCSETQFGQRGLSMLVCEAMKVRYGFPRARACLLGVGNALGIRLPCLGKRS